MVTEIHASQAYAKSGLPEYMHFFYVTFLQSWRHEYTILYPGLFFIFLLIIKILTSLQQYCRIMDVIRKILGEWQDESYGLAKSELLPGEK